MKSARDPPAPKIGAGHLQAFARQGLAELRNAVSLENTIATQHAEPGLFGTAVPQEIAAERSQDAMDGGVFGSLGSSISDRLGRAADMVKGREGREQGRDATLERE